MKFSKSIKIGLRVKQLPNQPIINSSFKRFRKPSPCDVCLYPRDKRPCFDMRKVTIERGNQCHAKLIRSFLYTHYWPREPSICGLWMGYNCPYLDVLTEKYSHQGDRFLAFEQMDRTNERKLIGVCVANKVWAWMIDELEEWAHYTASPPERQHMYFTAHCLKQPNLFKKYNVDFIYDIEILGTAAEVTGHGVATQLLRTALAQAQDLRYPIAQLVSVSQYTTKCCKRTGMKEEWSMNYTDFVDDAGQRVFFPRRPHHTVRVYSRRYDPRRGGDLPCKVQYHPAVEIYKPPS